MQAVSFGKEAAGILIQEPTLLQCCGNNFTKASDFLEDIRNPNLYLKSLDF